MKLLGGLDSKIRENRDPVSSMFLALPGKAYLDSTANIFSYYCYRKPEIE
jgi:hypothetical protein